MNNKEINDAMSVLSQLTSELEYEYIENGGEVTGSTEKMEEEIDAIKNLLNTEGVDSLGRWLKAKEDKIKTLKAEKDFVARQIQATEKSIEYIKAQVYKVMTATGTDRIKGTLGYSFAPAMSTTTSVDKSRLNEMFAEAIEKRVRDIIPNDVTISLGASVKLVDGDELPSYYIRTSSPSCKFMKPRAKSEE